MHVYSEIGCRGDDIHLTKKGSEGPKTFRSSVPGAWKSAKFDRGVQYAVFWNSRGDKRVYIEPPGNDYERSDLGINDPWLWWHEDVGSAYISDVARARDYLLSSRADLAECPLYQWDARP